MKFTDANLNRLRASVGRRSKKLARAVEVGLKAGGLYVQSEAQKRVPVEYGPLRASANTRAEGKGFDTKVYVTFGTEYAVYVHENTDEVLRGEPRPSGLGDYWDGSQGRGESKFLEKVYLLQRKQINRVIQAAVEKVISK